MRSEYISIETAINWFEDFKAEIFADKIKRLENEGNYLSISNAKDLAHLLFYVLSKPIGSNSSINRIGLYGKAKGFDSMIKIDIDAMEFHVDGLSKVTFMDSHKRYRLEHSYNYSERFRADYNYAVLVNEKYGGKDEILYSEISVKYDEFLQLIKDIKNHLKGQAKYYLNIDEE